MIDFTRFKKGPDFCDWLRQPQGQKFIAQIREHVELEHENLIGACRMSEDARVSGALMSWKTALDMVTFLAKAGKESATEDDD